MFALVGGDRKIRKGKKCQGSQCDFAKAPRKKKDLIVILLVCTVSILWSFRFKELFKKETRELGLIKVD